MTEEMLGFPETQTQGTGLSVFYSAVALGYPQALEPLSAHTPAAQPSVYPLASTMMDCSPLKP